MLREHSQKGTPTKKWCATWSCAIYVKIQLFRGGRGNGKGGAYAVPKEPAYPAEDGSVDGRERAAEERPLALNARTSTNQNNMSLRKEVYVPYSMGWWGPSVGGTSQ